MFAIFTDRAEAGAKLADELQHLAGEKTLIVLALPRGGVPVAAQVARALKAPLDVLVVRKIGAPGQPEFAIGAIAAGGAQVLDRATIASLGVNEHWLTGEIERQQAVLERRQKLYRGNRPFPDLSGRTVVLVDDGLATGSTMKAAARALRQQRPRRIIIAVPVAPTHVDPELINAADELVVLHQPHTFHAVGQFYQRFDQTSDDEVRDLLEPYLAASEA